MKRIMSLMLGLSLLSGMAVFAGAPGKGTKSTTKSTKTKSTKTKSTKTHKGTTTPPAPPK